MHVCGLKQECQPNLMFLHFSDFHTSRLSMLSVSGPRLRESFLSLMIYRVSGLDEPPLDASPTPAPLAICQCRLQYTEPYVGSWVRLTLKQSLCLVTVAEHFHHYTLGGSPCVITYNGSTRRIFTPGDLSLLPCIVPEVFRCWQVELWIM